ncbi:nucleotidyltransferase family protein [Aurantiacibacter sp. MUD11]|uniref:nucleotidyltransferase family protein n=1 Tax=Aurantiacibacter sp. MUD11 TaxID=3003265 RepID=UPI0022AB274B|nr:nucleotidyltransferase family protein [Aurantiacibacter sp. MUD11]WAT17748.1 nucleotidyltransferase family protein [Aurantiacibacter sp. MUD11]
MSTPADSQPLVAVLAAGRASRFGGGKLDEDCADKPVGQWVLDAVVAAGLEPSLIVVGPEAPQFAREAAGWRLLTNPAPQDGLGGSVAIAAREAERQSRALLVVLADMPLVAPEHLRRLTQCGTSAASSYPDGRTGVPACIAAQDVGKAARLDGDSGAGPMLAGLASLEVVEPDPGTLLDVDTPEDLERISAILAAR